MGHRQTSSRNLDEIGRDYVIGVYGRIMLLLAA